MIYIKSEINDPTINQAALLFMRHYRDSEFLDLVESVQSFNHTRDNGKDVALNLSDAVLEITLKEYKTFNPWSAAIAYAEKKTIYFNARKKNQTVVDRCETIMHEALHLLGYSHRGNKPDSYNLGSVPYKVGMMFGRYIAGKM